MSQLATIEPSKGVQEVSGVGTLRASYKEPNPDVSSTTTTAQNGAVLVLKGRGQSLGPLHRWPMPLECHRTLQPTTPCTPSH